MKQPSPRTLSRLTNSHQRKTTTTSSSSSSNYYYKLLFTIFTFLPQLTNALPIPYPIANAFHIGLAHVGLHTDNDNVLGSTNTVAPHKEPPLTESEFYTYMIASIALVLLGGIFAGLTLGLMGQDEVYLKVMAESGSSNEQKCAKEVLKLISKGKHWLLVTLLLSNVITNETLPVILDRFLGGGFIAVFSSTVSIVIFGEIIPQSVCVRYGLQLGAYFAPFVIVLMYLMYPVAYPIAKLLDYILGQDHGTLYRKSGLKTLVTLHKTMGVERLNEDEVTIISSVLDLKAKPVSDIMTPIEKVYTMSSDKILDEDAVEEIFNAGFSRIPIHLPNEPTNFVGMLLVRILISYDPEDALPVSSFPLATLPETGLDTSCLNILNYFQEGKSHMVIVSETPGMDTGAKGVLTLEDVIEELIGEEIIDESDVYIDLSKNVKRTNPGPLAKRNITNYLQNLYSNTSSTNANISSNNNNNNHSTKGLFSNSNHSLDIGSANLNNNNLNSINVPTYYNKRISIDSQIQQFQNSRSSSINSPIQKTFSDDIPIEITNGSGSGSDLIHHPIPTTQINATTLNGMKPSNLAINPLQTTNTHVKIKKQPQLTNRDHLLSNSGTSTTRPSQEDFDRSSLLSPTIVDNNNNNTITTSSNTRSGTPDYGAVHSTEADAFVQGVKDNIQRKISSSNPNSDKTSNDIIRQFLLPQDKRDQQGEIDLTDSYFKNNSSGIPVPRDNISTTTLMNGQQNSSQVFGKYDGNNGLTPTSSTIGIKSKNSIRSDSISIQTDHNGNGNNNGNLENQSIKTGNLIENIISIRGVNKTVIESALSDTEDNSSKSDEINNNSQLNGDEDDSLIPNFHIHGSDSNTNHTPSTRRDSKKLWNW